MSPYAAAGTFYSRIFDAETPVSWNSIQWTATTSAGTGVSIAVRGGNTAVPDATWSDFLPMSSGGPITINSQYIQYREMLATTNADVTPQLEDIIISTGHAPTANPDWAIVLENGSRTFPSSGPGSLTANDTDADPGDVLRVVGVTAPVHGSVVLNPDGSVRYTPAATYSGPDAFTYTVSDGLLTASATVTLGVRLSNTPPVASNDSYSVAEDTTLTVPAGSGVLANDTDPEHDPLTAVVTSLPQHGVVNFNANGGFTYVPMANYNGPDAFRYKANDGGDDSNEASVNITVTPVNDAPSFTKGADQIKAGSAGAQTVPNWATNVSAGPSDEAGQALNFIVTADNPALFTVPAISPNGTLTYTPANVAGTSSVTVQFKR